MSKDTIADAAPDEAAAAHFVIGELGTIEQVDDAACALLGYGKHELIGLHGSEVVPPDAQPATAVSVDRMRRGEIDQRVGRLRRKDGTVLVVYVRGQPLAAGRVALTVHRLPEA